MAAAEVMVPTSTGLSRMHAWLRSTSLFVFFGRPALVAAGALLTLGFSLPACADIGMYSDVAVEDGVISDGLPDTNLDWRSFSENLTNQLLNTSGAAMDYPNDAATATAQEYIIFKFSFDPNIFVDPASPIYPADIRALSPGQFQFVSWFTLQEGTPGEETFGEFDFYEITAGDPNWTDNQDDIAGNDPTAVTFNSLGGTFSDISSQVAEIDSGEGNPLYPGKLVSNASFNQLNILDGIPVDTLNRLITGESVGLAMGSVLPDPGADSGRTNLSIHSTETFFGFDRQPRLTFQWCTGDDCPPAMEGALGDFNNNLVNGSEDYTVWRNSLGSNDPLPNDDGLGVPIRKEHYDLWKGNFGVFAGGSTAIPEPATLALLALAMVGILVCRWR